MKILVVTLPQRKEPTNFPPLGALSVINYTRKHSGQDIQIELFNIDAHRPPYEQVLERICQFQPDILGISAVVSTAYAYTKKLALDVKRNLPDSLVVVGGNLGASAEILLRKAGVDLCVLGEGEKVFLNVINLAKITKEPSDYKDIRGLCFLDSNDKLVNTGYETPLSAEEIWDVDWADLERDGSLARYFQVCSPEDIKRDFFLQTDDQRFDPIASGDITLGHLACAKGCVSRCTFCHRWDKGLRHIPVDEVMKRLDVLIKRYNVGVVEMVAETFGSDKRWLDEFLERVKPYKILWRAGGVRTSVVDPELIQRMKDAGCCAIIYGNETGSSKMLEVMEKKVTLDDNYNAAKWTIESGLANVIQLVIGMPGESPETIRETIEYVKFGTTLSPMQDPRKVSINYAQALPGTPLYEFGRIRGLIGSDIDSEEQYLLSISDRDAADPLSFINFTNYPRLTLLSWGLLIRIEVRYNYMKKFGDEHYFRLLLADPSISYLPETVVKVLDPKFGASFGLFLKLLSRGKFSALLACYPTVFFRLRRFSELLMLVSILKEYGAGPAWGMCKDYVRYIAGVAKRPWQFQYRSLRKIVDMEVPPVSTDTPEMMPLRKGR